MTKQERGLGRPRRFDLDEALVAAQALFHDRGFDAVGVAALTDTLGISPPSFYAAFGSKAALFERVMDRYTAEGLQLEAFATPGGPPADALQAYLTAIARLYGACPRKAGCLVFEAARGTDGAESTAAARLRKQACRERIRSYLAQTHPKAADAGADMVVTILSGLSAGAREGWNEARLKAVAELTAAGLATILRSPDS